MNDIKKLKDACSSINNSVRQLVCDTPHGKGVFKTEDIDLVVQYVKSMEWHLAKAVEFAEEIEKFFNRK